MRNIVVARYIKNLLELLTCPQGKGDSILIDGLQLAGQID